MGGICKNLESNPIIVGGHRNHVHVLCSLSRKIALMKLIEEIKSHSSKWIKTKGKQYQKFYWQSGYGGFSIHESQINSIKEYIKKQEEHHKTLSFMDEYRALLNEFNIDYDERFVWD
ncbi:MAG: transposase [Bacteroidota bacterium]